MNVSMHHAASGLKATQTRHDVTAHDVSNVNTPGFEERRVTQAETAGGGTRVASIDRRPNSRPEQSNTDLTEETKEQIVNKNLYGANGRVFKVQDQMTSELIDLVG